MKFVLWKAPKGYEDALAPALMAGAAANGDEIVIKPTEEYRGPEFDGGILIGVVKREILWDHQAKGSTAIYLDKGYHRSRSPYGDRSLPEWWRICINAAHPTEYLMKVKRPYDRARLLPVLMPEKRYRGGDKIVILGSSAKFHHTHHLAHPTEWTRELVKQIREWTDRPIIYRPKPSWADAEPVEGTIFDHGGKSQVADTLKQAHAAVTYGSIASVDAIVAGVPCVVLGNAVARPVSTLLSEIEDPHWPDLAAREQWFANLCYCHWRPSEIESGLAWATTKEMMRYACAG